MTGTEGKYFACVWQWKSDILISENTLRKRTEIEVVLVSVYWCEKVQGRFWSFNFPIIGSYLS